MSKPFLIVFDSGARPEYINDVHEILCLPPGARVKYDYLKKYLSADAEQLLRSGAAIGTDVLLLFWQQKGFTRRPDFVKDEAADYVMFPTRIARIAAVDARSDKIHFDLELRGFPRGDPILMQPFSRLCSAPSNRPWKIFVLLSDERTAFQAIDGEGSVEAWRCVVENFFRNTHFSNDSFIYLRLPEFRQHFAPWATKTPAPCEAGRFRVPDCSEIYIDIENLEPPSRSGAAAQSACLEIACDDEELSPKKMQIPLRQYGLSNLRFEAAPVFHPSGKSAVIELSITRSPADGHGPKTKLTFIIAKPVSRWLLGSASLVVSVALGAAIAGKTLTWPWAIVALPFTGLAALALVGKLPRKAVE